MQSSVWADEELKKAVALTKEKKPAILNIQIKFPSLRRRKTGQLGVSFSSLRWFDSRIRSVWNEQMHLSTQIEASEPSEMTQEAAFHVVDVFLIKFCCLMTAFPDSLSLAAAVNSVTSIFWPDSGQIQTDVHFRTIVVNTSCLLRGAFEKLRNSGQHWAECYWQ